MNNVEYKLIRGHFLNRHICESNAENAVTPYNSEQIVNS